MRKLAIVGLLIFVIAGCSYARHQKENFDTCMKDVVCKAAAETWRTRAEVATTIAVTAAPVPGAAALPKVIGYLALGLAAIIGGAALNKKVLTEDPGV